MSDDTSSLPATVPATGIRSWLRPPFPNRGGLSSLQFIPLYLAAGMILFLALWTVVSFIIPDNLPRLWSDLLGEIVFAVSAIAPALLISRIEDRPFALYGLPAQQAFHKFFWSGVLWGIASLTLLLLAMRLAGLFYFGSLALEGGRAWKFALFWAVFFLFVALFEEYAFRGYPLFAFTEAAGFWPSALLLSVIFGYIHRGNPGETWIGALGATCIGLFFAFTRLRTGNLWFAVGMHGSWDWAQTFVFGVPNSGTRGPGHLLSGSLVGPTWLSGGSVGPEGSVLIFLLIAGLWVAFDRLHPAGKRSPNAGVPGRDENNE